MKRLLSVVLALAFLHPVLVAQQLPPYLVLFGGKVFTGDSSRPYVEAVAIGGERITATGSSRDILSLAAPRTKQVDLGGRVVIPGINDAHYHLGVDPSALLLQFKEQDPTWREVTDALAAALPKAREGTLIRGEIGPTILDEPEATRAALDKLAPHHPVMLSCWTGHASVLNSAALKMLGMKEDEPDPLGGRFVRDDSGKLTGLVLEYANFRLARRLSELTTDEEAFGANTRIPQHRGAVWHHLRAGHVRDPGCS